MIRKLELLLLLCCMARTVTTHIINNECATSKNCICTLTKEHYLYHCPAHQFKFSIKVDSNFTIKVDCMTKVNFEKENLPQIQPYAKSFTFTRCSLLGTNWGVVIKKYGVAPIKQLRVESATDFENLTLTTSLFENIKDVNTLILNEINLEAVNEDIFRPLKELKKIWLTNTGIRLLTNIFLNLTAVTDLNLSRNNLAYLLPKTFDTLTKLKYLRLESNNLRHLSEDAFQSQQNLHLLDLSHNQLEKVTDNIFKSLKKLVVLNLAHNNLRRLPETLFYHNQALKYVNLEGNLEMAHLPIDLFSNLTELVQVSLSYCNLNNLSRDLFYGSIHLKHIYLSHNRIQRLPEGIFEGLINLRTLDLSYNKILDLSDQLFTSLHQLETFNCENNLITRISQHWFCNLGRLTRINFNSNKICLIENEVFLNASNLREIGLSNNCLNIIEGEDGSSPFNGISSLEKLDVSHNGIIEFGDNWWGNTALKEIDLSYNRISYFDFTSFTGFPQQLKINVSHNNISTVNFQGIEGILQAQNLEARLPPTTQVVIDLNENPLECDCNLHDLVRYLDKSMDSLALHFFGVVAHNLTCALPRHLLGFPVTQLEQIMLTCTLEQLETELACPEPCSCIFYPWDKSLTLDCSSRHLISVPELNLPSDVFNKMTIYLQNNSLVSGPERNMGYENVSELYLFSNNITDIKWIPSDIKVLDLSSNSISHLDNDILSMLNSSFSTKVSLGNNPWRCDCSTENFTKFLGLHYSNKQLDIDNIKCGIDGNLLINLTTEDLCSNHVKIILIGILAALCLIGILIPVLVTAFFINVQTIKVWLYAHDTCLSYVTEEEIDKDKKYDIFISYAGLDEDFVSTQLVPTLEQGSHPYNICLNSRNWKAGEFIIKQIIQSVAESRRTLAVVSPSFLKSEWCKMEFRTAHVQALRERRSRLIVVIYGDVDLKSDVDEELKAYIETNTYIRWGERWFWDKLKYALPHSQENGRLKC